MTRAAEPRRLRIGLTDSEGPLARQVREVFHDSPVPVSRFVPLGSPDQEGRLSEIDGEAEFLRMPRRETIGDLDFLILAGSPADPECRELAAETGVPTYDMARTPVAAQGCAEILAALDPLPSAAAFTVLLPASEAGTAGIEELFAQAGDSLNFRPTSAPVFGSRLAFNLFRDAAAQTIGDSVASALEQRFADCAITVLCARVGVFHGYAASAVLTFPSDREARSAAARLSAAPGLLVGGAPGEATTAAAVEETRVLVDPPAAASGRLSLWFAFDGLALSAREALRAAEALLR